jgi:NADH-quinone oxidoreductase chain G
MDNNTIDMTINGKHVSTPKGNTILQAALGAGIYIPRLCWDRRLTPFGGCRICMVEVTGQRKLFAACSTPARPGMDVVTESDRIAKARKVVLELLLVHHPLDCPVCDKAGECELQDLSFKYGTSKSRFKGKRKHNPEILSAPLLERNPNRCILCGKCVRICQEHQGVGAIDFIGRGFDTIISPAFEETLDCEFCGQCVDICPVGALGSKPFRYRSRVWYMEDALNICPHCGCGCTVKYGISENRIIRGVGPDGVGISEGDLCGKGRYGHDFVYSDKRLKSPMIRKGKVLEEVSWEEAVAFLCQKLEALIKKHGAEAVGAIGSQRTTVEDNYMMQKFMRDVVGTNNIDSLAAFGYARAQAAIKQAFGLDALPINFNAALKAKYILVVESDVTSTHPTFGLKMLTAERDLEANLTVIDFKETKLARHATHWLRNKPGTAVAALNGMMKVIIDEELFAKDATSVAKFNELKTSLEEYTPEMVQARTGIDATRLAESAREFANAPSRVLSMTMGSNENNKGSDTVLAAANLLILVGEGPEALQLPAELSNTLGMFEAGVRPDAGPSHKPVEKGLGLSEMLYSDDSPIKALYVMGENLVVSFPQAQDVEEKLKAMELLIVQDIMLTDTAKLAHVVLPASSWSEKEGTFVGSTGIPQSIKKCSPEVGHAIADWMIFRNIARAMQKDTGLGNFTALKEEIARKVPMKFDTKSATAVFNPVLDTDSEPLDDEYGYTMVTGNLMQHSGSLTTLSKSLESVVSDAYMLINKQDAKSDEIVDDGFVKVISRRGEVLLKAKVTDEIPRGMLYVPAHFPHARVHCLTYPSANGEPSLSAVKLEVL